MIYTRACETSAKLCRRERTCKSDDMTTQKKNNMKTQMDDKTINHFYKIFNGLLMFILGLFSAWSWQILPPDMIRLFEKSRISQLIVVFMVIMFTLGVYEESAALYVLFVRALAIFLVYILMTKQHLYMFLFTVFGLVIMVMLTHFKENGKSEKTRDLAGKVRYYYMIAFVCIISLSILFYFVEKYKEFKNRESFLNFLVRFVFQGSTDQENTSSQLNTWNSPEKIDFSADLSKRRKNQQI